MATSKHPSSRGTVELATGVRLARSKLRYSFSRSSGPGGQAVNKVSTQAELRVRVVDIRGLGNDAVTRLRRVAGRKLNQDDEIVIQSNVHRSQISNKRECLNRLRKLVEKAATKPKIRKKKKPTRAMVERRLNEKRRRSEKKRSRRVSRDE